MYDGEADEEVILETFMQWREPCQQDLTDHTFEHLTQVCSNVIKRKAVVGKKLF